jgi:hypothetical protein
LEQIDDQHHEGDDEKDVNEAATHRADESEQPENEQNYDDGPEHDIVLLVGLFVLRAWMAKCAYGREVLIHHTFVCRVVVYINTNKVLADSARIAYNVPSRS